MGETWYNDGYPCILSFYYLKANIDVDIKDSILPLTIIGTIIIGTINRLDCLSIISRMINHQ